MKNKIKYFGLIICLVLCVFAFAGCERGTTTVTTTHEQTTTEQTTTETPTTAHVHSYNGYEKDSTGHYQKCSCGESGEKEPHTFGEYAPNGDATCKKDGTKSRICSVCGYKETVTDEGSKIEHTVVVDAAVAPTHTTGGKTAGSHCSACNTVIVKQEPVAALGHDDFTSAEWKIDNETGKHYHLCSCGAHVDEASHIYVKTTETGKEYQRTITTWPTATTDGVVTYKCFECNAEHTETIKLYSVSQALQLEGFEEYVIVKGIILSSATSANATELLLKDENSNAVVSIRDVGSSLVGSSNALLLGNTEYPLAKGDLVQIVCQPRNIEQENSAENGKLVFDSYVLSFGLRWDDANIVLGHNKSTALNKTSNDIIQVTNQEELVAKLNETNVSSSLYKIFKLSGTIYLAQFTGTGQNSTSNYLRFMFDNGISKLSEQKINGKWSPSFKDNNTEKATGKTATNILTGSDDLSADNVWTKNSKPSFTGDIYCLFFAGSNDGNYAQFIILNLEDVINKAYGSNNTDNNKHWFVDGAGNHIDEANHNLELVATVSEPDHSHQGEQTWECTVCHKQVSVPTSALGHGEVPQDATFTYEVHESKHMHYYVCSCEEKVYSECSFLNNKTEATDSTEELKGNYEYWTCEKCGQRFMYNSEEQKYYAVTNEATEKALLNHTCSSFDQHDAVASTCTQHGTVEYWQCKNASCNKKYSDAQGTNEITSIEAELLPHNYTETVGDDYLKSAATCTNKAVYYKSCSVCHELSTETFESGDPLGHSTLADLDQYSITKVTAENQLANNDYIVIAYNNILCGTGSTGISGLFDNSGNLLPTQGVWVFQLKSFVNGSYTYYALSFVDGTTSKAIVAVSGSEQNTLGAGSTIGNSLEQKMQWRFTFDSNGKAKIVIRGYSEYKARVINYNASTNKFCKNADASAYTFTIYKYSLGDCIGGKVATCTENGSLPYYECEKCHNYKIGLDGNEVTNTVVNALGHNYSAAWTWASDYSYARVTITCGNENNLKYVDAEKVTDISFTDTATCSEAGVLNYTATYYFDGYKFTNTTADIVSPAHHKYYSSVTFGHYEEVTGEFNSNETYYTRALAVGSTTEYCYTVAEKITKFAADTTYYVFIKTAYNYANGVTIAYDNDNSKYVATYTCKASGCSHTETQDVAQLGVKQAIESESTDLFYVYGIVVGAMDNANRQTLLIQDVATYEFIEIGGFVEGEIFSRYNILQTNVEPGDLVRIPVVKTTLVADTEADNGKVMLKSMIGYCNTTLADCVIDEEDQSTDEQAYAIHYGYQAASITTIKTQEGLTKFLTEGTDTLVNDPTRINEVVKLTGIIYFYKGGNTYNGLDFCMVSGDSYTKVNEMKVRIRAGNTKNIVGTNDADQLIFNTPYTDIFNSTSSKTSFVFTGDLYLVYLGGTTGYYQFVLLGASDVFASLYDPNPTIVAPTKDSYKIGTDTEINLTDASITITYTANDRFDTPADPIVISGDVLSEYIVSSSYDLTAPGTYTLTLTIPGSVFNENDTHSYQITKSILVYEEQYTVTFTGVDGTKSSNITVFKGATSEVPAATKLVHYDSTAGKLYMFTGWQEDSVDVVSLTNCTSNHNYVAKFDTYTVKDVKDVVSTDTNIAVKGIIVSATFASKNELYLKSASSDSTIAIQGSALVGSNAAGLTINLFEVGDLVVIPCSEVSTSTGANENGKLYLKYSSNSLINSETKNELIISNDNTISYTSISTITSNTDLLSFVSSTDNLYKVVTLSGTNIYVRSTSDSSHSGLNKIYFTKISGKLAFETAFSGNYPMVRDITTSFNFDENTFVKALGGTTTSTTYKDAFNFNGSIQVMFVGGSSYYQLVVVSITPTV